MRSRPRSHGRLRLAPPLLASSGTPEERTRANAMFRRVTGAYDVLCDPRRRAELAARGKSTSGLKPELVARLTAVAAAAPGAIAGPVWNLQPVAILAASPPGLSSPPPS